jgi:hypothetical protein
VPVALKLAASEGGVMSTSPSIYIGRCERLPSSFAQSSRDAQEVLVQSRPPKMRNNAVYSFEDKGDV